MVDILQSLLAKENCLITGCQIMAHIIEKNTTYPEDYVEIIKEDNVYKILEIHRDRQKLFASAENVTEACVYGAIASKRLFSRDVNRNNASIIREYIEEGKEECVLKFLQANALEDYYSICIERENKISLIKKEITTDVKYAGQFIVKDASLSRGYVVLSNFSEKLKALTEFYQNELRTISCEIDFMKIAKLYIL